MKSLFTALLLLVLATACQQENLSIEAPYRVKINAYTSNYIMQSRQAQRIILDLKTDSYYRQTGYQLVYYQQAGLGRLYRDSVAIRQRVPVALPLGQSEWLFTPESTGVCQIILIAQQERGYTRPDTVRLNFQIVP
ncbi:hypothetical protein GCM10023189_32470 [Nibrella saemangeumensis]|uniref:DUF3872 domain-containing protein n=1 Tax=Nibrella saemangeumensis TaxID=1084526 RepID=A0ABP8N0F4_9BACT